MTTSKRSWRSRGGLVTIGTVLSLVTGLGLTVLGLGAADQAVARFDAASWMWSKSKGEMARVNGVTARVDTRVDVAAGPRRTRCRSPRTTGSCSCATCTPGRSARWTWPR